MSISRRSLGKGLGVGGAPCGARARLRAASDAVRVLQTPTVRPASTRHGAAPGACCLRGRLWDARPGLDAVKDESRLG